MITRQRVNSGLRLAVKRLWDKDASVEQLRDKACTADAWLVSQGGDGEIVAVKASRPTLRPHTLEWVRMTRP